jgi:hypothetical protein
LHAPPHAPVPCQSSLATTPRSRAYTLQCEKDYECDCKDKYHYKKVGAGLQGRPPAACTTD